MPTKLTRLNLKSLLRFAKNEKPYPEGKSQPESKPGLISSLLSDFLTKEMQRRIISPI